MREFRSLQAIHPCRVIYGCAECWWLSVDRNANCYINKIVQRERCFAQEGASKGDKFKSSYKCPHLMKMTKKPFILLSAPYIPTRAAKVNGRGIMGSLAQPTWFDLLEQRSAIYFQGETDKVSIKQIQVTANESSSLGWSELDQQPLAFTLTVTHSHTNV